MYSEISTSAEKLVTYIRDGLIEQEHYGYVVRCDKSREIEKIGEDKNYPFYLRSCAKPLQAALIIDYGLDKEFNLTEEEVAICCASHAGETVHIDIVKTLLKKFGLSISDLKCPNHEPLSKTAQKEMILNNTTPEAVHNNCSGKHVMMLGLCLINGWDIKTYDDINHPLQKAITDKIYKLCDIHSDYPVTKDGCGVPVHSMPLANMVMGYLNLFCDSKYLKIKNAFLGYPYLIGGEDRTDTKIIQNSNGLIAKVGAGGLCIVVNPDLEEGFVVKICDSNMSAREILTVDLINNLHWANININHDITTLSGQVIGKIKTFA